MIDKRTTRDRTALKILAGILVLFTAISIVGITWGLPSRDIDKFLFGDSEPWSGERIYRLAGAGEKFSSDRGADVDADPLKRPGDGPVLLTGSDKDVAKIYLRYRLYTYQPDEMITMMALAGMNPRRFDLDDVSKTFNGKKILEVSALKVLGLDRVEKAIAGIISGGEAGFGEGVMVTNLRHKQSLEMCLKAVKRGRDLAKKEYNGELLASDLNEAAYCLGLIIGESVEADVLDRIFSQFCIGK